MRLSSQFIHCNRKECPTCRIEIRSKEDNIKTPITVTIEDDYTSAQIHIFLSSIRDLINFKNSGLGSFNKAMREVNNA